MERELHSGVPGGLALMREAFDYMRCYLDEHHHPAEDAIFGRLAQRQPDLGEVVEAVQLEHATMAEATGNLATRIDALGVDEKDESATMLRTALNAFMLAQRRHMRFEERFLFPFVAAGLTVMDNRYVAARLGRLVDPLDSPGGRIRYPHLVASI